MYEGEVSFGRFFEAGEDAAEVLEIAEHDLDFMALLIEEPIGVALDRSRRVERNNSFGFPGLDGIAAKGAIGEHGFGSDLIDRIEYFRRIAGLACRQTETARVAKRVTGGTHFAGKVLSTAVNSLIYLIFFSSAAQAWAHTAVLSSINR